MNKSDVMQTRRLGICVSCEICSAACPEHAIIMEYRGGQFLPLIDYDKCTSCRLCLEICPGIDLDHFELLSRKVSADMFDGHWSAIYTGHSRDLHMRKNSTSGGLVSTLLAGLMEAEEFEVSFILPFENVEDKPARLKATNRVQDIWNSARSKYIPASVYNVIKALEERKELRCIVVGTPCQILGIKKYMEKKRIPESQILFLGLFCSRTLNHNFVRYIEDAYAKSNEKLVKFEFRTKERSGWPGHSKAYFSSGRELIIDRKIRMRLNDLFQLKRCIFCTDRLNRNADISFGDCYIEGKAEFHGVSNMIIRTSRGEDILNRYSHLFILEEESIDAIRQSQILQSKIGNLKLAGSFISRNHLNGDKGIGDAANKLVKWRLSILEIFIRWGRNYSLIRTRLYLLLSKAEMQVKDIMKMMTFAAILAIAVLKDILSPGSKQSTPDEISTKKNIILVGYHLFNKGLQSLTFSTVDNIKRRQPDKNIYFFSSRDFHRVKTEKDNFNFNILPWDLQIKLHLLDTLSSALKIFRQGDYTSQMESDIRNVIKDTEAFIDISGYALSSQWGFTISIQYLLNIIIAKKFSVPFYIFPQSVGPFNYSWPGKMILYPLLKKYLKYPGKIYIREDAGLKSISRFTTKNVEKSADILINHTNYDLENIFKIKPYFHKLSIEPSAVGVVPNVRVLERTDSQAYFAMYFFLIEKLLDYGRKVYLLPYARQDLEIIEEMKDYFRDEDKVKILSDELNAIELENIVRQFQFLIASRYHSIVHAYRNGIPVIAIGWSKKYPDLLNSFDQGKYYFDIREKPGLDVIAGRINELINNSEQEREKILDKLKIQEVSDVFEILGAVK